MKHERLKKQIAFIAEADKLKHVFRKTYLMDNSRHENDAEHSWHLSLMALLLSEHAAGVVDLFRVVQMVLIHDIVEIDAGDTFCYDDEGQKGRVAKETKAAERLFALLPDDQAQTIRMLWDEFEQRTTPEARFAAALDRLQPLLHNYYTGGYAWKENRVTSSMVLERNRHICEGSPALWEFAERLIKDAVAKGYLKE